MSRRTSRSTSRIVLTVAILIVGVFATPIYAESTAWDFLRQNVGHRDAVSRWLLLIVFTTSWSLVQARRTLSSVVEPPSVASPKSC